MEGPLAIPLGQTVFHTVTDLCAAEAPLPGIGRMANLLTAAGFTICPETTAELRKCSPWALSPACRQDPRHLAFRGLPPKPSGSALSSLAPQANEAAIASGSCPALPSPILTGPQWSGRHLPGLGSGTQGAQQADGSAEPGALPQLRQVVRSAPGPAQQTCCQRVSRGRPAGGREGQAA